MPRQNYTDDIVAEQSFASWHEYINHVCNAPFYSYEKNEDRKSRRVTYAGGWAGTGTWEAAEKLAREGWPDLGVHVKTLSDDLFAKLSKYCLRPEPRYVYEGHGLDVGRWIDGEPEHWLVMEEGETLGNGQRVARIVYNQTASCGISTEVMRAKGATVAALVRLLDYADIRSEIELIGVLREDYKRGKRIIYRVDVKNASQDLDFDIVSFALAHPASFRRIGFACMETFPKDVCEQFEISQNGSYSYPADLNATERANCDVYIGSQLYGEPEWTDTQSAQQWVLKQLVNVGVQLTEEAPV
jgi:hypothetical protein